MLADLEAWRSAIDAAQKKAKGGDKEAKAQLDVMEPALALLREGKPARTSASSPPSRGRCSSSCSC